MAYTIGENYAARQRRLDQTADLMRARGLTRFNDLQNQHQQSANDLGNYLSGGQYTSADNQSYRDQATKAIADLDEQLKTYTKSSNEYKTLESYRNYYASALNDFDRIDVATNAVDYVNSDAWHDEATYKAQRASMQSNIDAIQAEMDAMEDQTTSDYLRLQGYRDLYQDLLDNEEYGLAAREKRDRLFNDADDFVSFQNAQDYKNSVQLQKQIADAEARMKELEPQVGGRFRENHEYVYNDPEAAAEYQDLKLKTEEWKKDLDRMQYWQAQITNWNIGDYDPTVNYQEKVDQLKEAKEAAKTDEERAEIDMQLRVLAGDNYDGTIGNIYDETTNLGRYLMKDYDQKKAQSRLDEINQELKDLGVSVQNWMTIFDQDLDAMAAGSGAAAPEYSAEDAEKQKHIDELRREKADITAKMATAQRYQDRAKIAQDIPAIANYDELAAEGEKHMSADGSEYYHKNYDARARGEGDMSGFTVLKNYEALLADDEKLDAIASNLNVDRAELSKMIRAAIGAEWTGQDIGYTVQDVLQAYEGQMAQLAGYETANKINGINSGVGRTLVQTGYELGQGVFNFPAQIGKFFTDEYKPENKSEVAAAVIQQDMKDRSKVLGYVGQAAQVVGNMLPSIALGYLTGGVLGEVGVAATTAGNIGKAAGAVAMGLGSAGQSYQQALAQGWDKNDARAYASILGAAEGAMEYLLSGVGAMAGVAEESLIAATRGIDSAFARFAAELGIRNASEVFEEYLQNKLQGALEYAWFYQEAPKLFDEEDWDTVVVTTLSTALLEGGHVFQNTYGARKLGNQLAGNVIPPKGLTQSRQQSNAIVKAIGERMKGNEPIVKTLEILGEDMDEGTEAYEIAKAMSSGKIPANAMNVGNLFRAYMQENRGENYMPAILAIQAGATAYHGIQKQTEILNADQTHYEEMVKANPEATVLDKTAGELTSLGITDASIALEYSAIVNKILNGQTPTASEMTKLVGRSDAAKASRVILSQRNPALTEHLDAVGMKEAIGQIASDIDTIKKQQAGLMKASVVQAALDAVEQMKVNDATRGAKLDPTKMQQAETDLRQAQSEIDTAKTKIKALESMSFKELASLENNLINQAMGVENVAAHNQLKDQMAKLNERADELQKVKMPSKAQRAELVQIRQQQNQIKQQMVGLQNQATDNVNKLIKEAEAAGKAEGEAAQNTSAEAPAAGDYYVDPTGRVRTREDYIAVKTAQGMTEEEANAEFDRDAEMAGGVKHGEQATDNDRARENAVGERNDREADRARGDQSVRSGEQRANGERHPIRPQSDGLGQRDESVDNSAVVTDSKDVSSLGEEFSWLEDLTDRLTQSGFQYINFVTKGNLYNSAGKPVPAMCIGREMFLVVDQGPRGFIDAVARHEELHMKLNMLRANSTFGKAYAQTFVTGALQKLMTTEEYIAAYRKYSDGDERHPGGYGETYKNVNQVERIHMINEEILCDMVGGLTTFEGLDMSEYQEGAWEYLRDSNFDEVTANLANPEHKGPIGTIFSPEDLGVFPHNVPKDTLLSDKNVDAPSTEVASIQDVARDAKYGFAKALGFYVDGKTKSWYRSKEDAQAQRNGFKVFGKDIDPKDNPDNEEIMRQVEDSPLANLINWAVGKGISEESAKRQLQLFVGLGQIVDKTNNFHMAMQMFGSSLFTAMKLNSDNQYGTSEDVANICTKTQSVIDYMSEEMKRVKRGLTDDEILEIYRRIEAEGLPVNCPECYVFSRWIGIGGLLDNIYQYQNLYKDMTPEQVAAEHARLYQKVLDEQEAKKKKYIETATTREKDPLTLEEAQAEAEKKFTLGKVRSNMVKDYETKYEKLSNKKADLEAQGKELNQNDADQLAEYEANITPLRSLVWIEKVYFGGKVTFNDKGLAPAGIDLASKVNKHFEVPSDVLFDLNAGEEFAYRYPEAWAFRTTQGAGYGKAITPTAEAHLGESIMVTANTAYLKTKQNAARKYQGNDELERHEASVSKNIFYSEKGPITPKSERGKVLTKTLKKELNQLFMGGQRLQSTSDSRYDTAIDTLLIAVELQAMRAGAQIYTKVLGAVPFYDSINGFVNMSMMPLVYGRMAGKQISGGLDENGNPVDSPVGGVNPKLIEEYRKKYPHAGTITIGVNDQHIRAMFNQVIRDFIIPYHASGGKTEIVAEMRRIQDKALTQGRTDMPQSTDYTLTQTDKFLSDTALRKDMGYTEEQIEEAKRFREMRLWILTGKGTPHMDLLQAEGVEGLTRAQKNARKVLAQLYKSIHDEGGRWHGVQLAKGKVDHQIFPNEFWDTSANYEDSGVNTQRYLDYCEALGVLHRFSGQGVKRGRVVSVNGYDPGGNQIALTDLAYQIDKDGNYVMTTDEDGNEVRAIEPFFWKTLVDRRMYDNEGNYMEQTPVTLNGLVGLGSDTNEDAEAAVAAGVDLIANPKTGFAKPVEGERSYNRKKSLKLAEQPVARSALAMTAPGYQTTDEKAATDDLGQKLYVTPSNGGWEVERDTDGALLNTDYIIDELGLPIYRNPKDAYAPPEKREDSTPKHRTSNPSTQDTYLHIFDEYIPKTYGDKASDLLIVDASSGLGLGANHGKQTLGEENVIDLEPYPGTRSPAPDYKEYGSLIHDMENGQKQKADFIISNAVINVMAQDAREEHLAALLRMMDDEGTIYINPAFPKRGWDAYKKAIPLEEYKARKAAGEDVSKVNVMLSPDTANTGAEIYTASSKSVQKGYAPEEFIAFAKDVAKQALGYDVDVRRANGVNGLKTGFLITRPGGETVSRFSLSPEQQARADFNQKQTEVGSGLKTLNSDKAMTRSKTKVDGVPANVGKQMGDQIWVHKNYANRVVPQAELDRAVKVLGEKFPNFQYNTIMYDKKTGNIRFDEAPNFDTAREPIPGGMVTVMPNGDTKVNYSDYIWHHKWMWVDNDYTGFDVADSWNWSKQWLSTLQEVANGSTRGPVGWNQQMDKYGLPKDPASEVEIKDRKAEIARIEGKPVKAVIPPKAGLTKAQPKVYNEARSSQAMPRSENNGRTENAAGNQPVVHRLAEFLQKNNWARSYLQGAREGAVGIRARDLWRTTENRQRQIINDVADYFAAHPFVNGKTLFELFDYGTPDFIDYFFEQAAKDPDALWTWLNKNLEGPAEELIDIFDKGLKDTKSSKKYRAGFTPTALDNEYLQAVKKNDTVTLARMVNEAAKKAGYNKEFFQHAKTYFPVFSKGEFGFHLGSESQAADFVADSLHDINPDLFLHLFANVKNPYVLPKALQKKLWNAKTNSYEQRSSNDYEDWNVAELAAALRDSGDFDKYKGMLNAIAKDPNANTRKYASLSRQRVTNILKDAGYDALMYENDVEGKRDLVSPYTFYDTERDNRDAYILWDPTKLKSADLITYDEAGNIIPLSERFDTQEPRFRYAMADAQYNNWAPEFYSKMENTIKEWTNGKGQPLGPKMAANQVVGWLRGKGVKAEEIKWSGIVPYLEGKKAVTRDELLGVMAENEIKIETKVLEKKASGEGYYYQGMDPRDGDERTLKDVNELMDYIDELGRDLGYEEGSLNPKPDPFDGWVHVMDPKSGKEVTTIQYHPPSVEDNTRWSQYSTHNAGGYNYREILFKQSGSNVLVDAMNVHWDGETGILAHARLQDMLTGENATPTIFVEEIQSDLHNAGAQGGFVDQKTAEEAAEYRELKDQNEAGFWELDEDAKARMEQLEQKFIGDKRDRYKKALDNYNEIAPKIGALASDIIEHIWDSTGDYDSVSYGRVNQWLKDLARGNQTLLLGNITGDENADAKNLKLTNMAYDAIRANNGQELLRNFRAATDERYASYNEYQLAANTTENLVPDAPFAGSSDTYHEYVMKHLLRLAAEGGYDRIAWTTADMQSKRWSPEYAEGYKIEYDQKIPKFMSKYVKQWGAKVGSVTLDNGEEVWSVDITPEMKRSVLETGQPLFSLAHPAPDPEHQLFDDLLGVAQSNDPDLIADWVTSQLDKNEQAKENARLRPPPVPSRSFVPKVTDSENAVLDAAIAELIDKHGRHRPSEKNATGFVIPKKNAEGSNLSRVTQNVGSSEQMKTNARQFKKFALTEDAATYVATTNEDQIRQAKQVIREDGFETALKNFNRYVNDPTVGFTKWGMELNQQIALGQQLLIEAGVNGNTRACLDVLTSLVMLGSQAGQSLQAMRLLKQSGPIGELYYAQKVVDKFNKQYQKLIEGKKMAQITIGQEYADAVVNASTEEEREAALKDLKQHIADQLPVTFMDRWNAWRYLSMLGNLRTHIRNVIGNAVFVPLRVTKDLMAAGGEYLATKAGLMDETDRTKAIAVSRDYLDFAKQDAETMKQELQGNGKYNPAQEILNARKVLPGVLDKGSRGNGWLLEEEDWQFLRPAYVRALGQVLMHSGYTVEQLQGEGGPEAARALNNARRIAIEEAQRATYRDFSAAAAALNRLKQSGGVGGVLMEGVLPFTKTPINILRRGIEYSPLGLLTSVTGFVKDVKDSGGVKNADIAKAIDRLSAGMTGTMVMVLGALLARIGVLRGKKDDEKEENFDKLQGYQDYSLQIGDTSFTIDWAAPTALPLFVGAAANDILSGGDDIKWGDIWDVMMMVSEPMLSLSMLEGLNNVIASASYAKGGQKVMTIAGSAAQSYLGQAFPTLLGQMARSIDGTRRTSYVDKNSSMPAGMQRFIQTSVQGKTPGWESQKTPYIDAWGREDTVSSKFLGALENFLSPSYINMVKSTDVDDEIKRLYGEVKDTAILPAVPAKYFSVNGETKNLTSDEYVSYAKDVGSTKFTLLSRMFYDPRYLALSDAERAKAIGYIYTYASTAGKYHVDPSYDIHRQGAWIEEAEAMPNDIQRFDRIWAQIEKALKD